MKMDLYSYSGIGGRPVNEDSYVTGNGYFVVSDGLGGHSNGELASAAATQYISENITVADLSDEHISNLIIGADKAVKQNGEGGMATLAALFTDGNIIRICNIGDSRVYYFRDGKIMFRTKDHSVCQASVDMGEMTDIEVRNSADRSILFKVLGDSDPLKLPKPYDLIEPKNDDAFLICSDGFWEHIYEQEMEADLLKAQSAKDWLENMLNRHLIRSGNNGDNYTAICGIIHSHNTVPRAAEVHCENKAEKSESDIPSTVMYSDNAFQPFMIIIFLCAMIALFTLTTVVTFLAVKSGNNKADVYYGSTSDSEYFSHSDISCGAD